MRVLLFGTFDILHPGHQSLFQQAHHYGKTVVAVIARDNTVKKLKKHSPYFTEKQRLKNLQKTNWANKVFLGDKKKYFKIIKKIKPDIICLGYDQKFFIKDLRQMMVEWGLKIKIIRLSSFHPKKYKSSKYARYKIH
ncbi:MAG TPA: FAD synthase [Candidatus Magasanikbacteria bacterium]|uniref:FAD synthase n=2 Tax=Candidatus Magasanikiibacteriota TaxID=1752731 RepID=A0A0G1A6K2_9BACT|nr:MAG: FAD synthase [Candidatus Magasanikbacteria bacterium GW2011_GWC2_41_17]KKS56579.1 MAG: FAD synthase [Candidatus Magasanikbacteria bacterium GW2011_GWA2_42_32]HBV58194.1 FAD synthase [Candidatus Magasanikbacteria bacterium]HBX15865.1 FAD synthase [Candidatus Magasanikbacteria bacterium]